MRHAAARSRRRTTMVVTALLVLAAPAPAAHAGSSGGAAYGTASQAPTPAFPPGGADTTQPAPGPSAPGAAGAVPAPTAGQTARVLSSGLAVAPAGAPAVVQAIITAANRIAKATYLWGGGHARWNDKGYDCSGSVSYALHGAGLLDTPLVSGDLAHWGLQGPGTWVTIYANAAHVYMTVAGLRFDTSGQQQSGTRWQPALRTNRGFHVRHPAGL
ncbi:MAG TPA: hypothetical protein VMT10_00920 [Solirubrobacteraceae bacterium]|nr:hypothetical protein [Solirubrobacteraceae bacterium]